MIVLGDHEYLCLRTDIGVVPIDDTFKAEVSFIFVANLPLYELLLDAPYQLDCKSFCLLDKDRMNSPLSLSLLLS